MTTKMKPPIPGQGIVLRNGHGYYPGEDGHVYVLDEDVPELEARGYVEVMDVSPSVGPTEPVINPTEPTTDQAEEHHEA